MSQLPGLQEVRVQDLDRVIATMQDNIKRVMDQLTSNPLASIEVQTVNFPDSAHSTTHQDGTVGYDVLVPHGLNTRTPNWFPTAVSKIVVSPTLTAADMSKVVIALSPDNTALNRTPFGALIITCSQPSVQAQIVFF